MTIEIESTRSGYIVRSREAASETSATIVSDDRSEATAGMLDHILELVEPREEPRIYITLLPESFEPVPSDECRHELVRRINDSGRMSHWVCPCGQVFEPAR